ncbi:hypothetical protein M407DRAFT_23803 [Tulasnella calospora MUT 4182]|uniref:PEHE domain-containing protein n=1 Tax=Tulasnella calospora MUT 4182 TaxID=1051891 RepID=A0A0C3M005_9AGAM|nr:hypothetical protein M407DRAFT_23803 [Tulasnella calospora MUT 4182]
MASGGSSRSTAVDVPSPSSPPPLQPRRSTRASFSNKPASVSSHMSEPPDSAAEPPSRPSLKALGKRPERQAEQNQPQQPELPASSDVQTASNVVKSAPPLSKPPPKKKSKAANHGQTEKTAPEEVTKRRVLPQRNRRGGPGVGSSAIDAMILDSQQKAYENQFIIPPDSIFVMTTDHRLVPEAPEGAEESHQSHFSKPEVQAATKEQAMIETPEFAPLPEGAAEIIDTSDAVYIKRHRKYETFEKRQRLREKETLQYEHFKLRERIDELRAMDASAFSGVSIPGSSASDAHPDHGEEAKRLMLKEAEELDRRYTILLPGSGDKKAHKKDGDDREGSHAGSTSDIGVPGSGGGIRLRLKRGKGSFPAHPTVATELPRDSEEVEAMVEDTLAPPDGTDHTDFKEDVGLDGADEHAAFDEGDYLVESDQEQDAFVPGGAPRKRSRVGNNERSGRSGSRRHSSPPVRKRIRLVTGPELSHSPNPPPDSASPAQLSHPPPSPSPLHWAPPPRAAPPPVPILIQTALKSITEPNAKRRQARRGQQPFGVPFAPIVDVFGEFELPSWIMEEGLEIRAAHGH